MQRIKKIFSFGLDLVLPHLCAACRQKTGGSAGNTAAVCMACFHQLDFISDPLCQHCGLPFEAAMAEGILCEDCQDHPPKYAQARSACRYQGTARRLVLAFKHGDRTDLAPLFARWMAVAGADMVRDCDLLVPVPLYWRRLFSRGHNQADVLAWHLGQTLGLPVDNRLLCRTVAVPSHGAAPKAVRQRALKGAFSVRAGKQQALRGKRIVLVDDVMTAGDTANACAQILLRAGAQRVSVLCFARVVP